MPFEIVRSDIVNMQVDAVVNTANPKPLALQIAVREISTFLLENEMQIYLVVFGKE